MQQAACIATIAQMGTRMPDSPDKPGAIAKIRILLTDDHTVLREALRAAFDREPDLQIVGEAGDARETLELALRLAPDVVVMDVGMPGMSGVDITRSLVQANAAIKVLALSTFMDELVIRQMLDAGAMGYVAKSASSEDLMRAIRTVASGRTFLCPWSTSAMVDSLRQKTVSVASECPLLSPREIQVLKLLAEGKSSPEIAEILQIATSTANAHRRNIMRSLDLHSVAQLTKYAISRGIAKS